MFKIKTLIKIDYTFVLKFIQLRTENTYKIHPDFYHIYRKSFIFILFKKKI